MKRESRFLFVAVVLFLSTTLGSFINLTHAADPSLVTHWAFDESSGTTAANEVSSSYTGSLKSTPTWTAGKLGNALSFNGSDYVAIGNVPEINGASQATLAAWIKRATPYGTVEIGKQTNTNDFAIEAWSDGYVYFDVSNGSWSAGGLSLNDTDWHHVALVFDGTQSGNAGRLKAYVDGVLQPLEYYGTIPTRTTTNTTAFNIGMLWGTYSNGLIDDVYLYSRALSAVEVQGLMAGND